MFIIPAKHFINSVKEINNYNYLKLKFLIFKAQPLGNEDYKVPDSLDFSVTLFV